MELHFPDKQDTLGEPRRTGPSGTGVMCFISVIKQSRAPGVSDTVFGLTAGSSTIVVHGQGSWFSLI